MIKYKNTVMYRLIIAGNFFLIFLNFGCGPNPEETRDQWFDYSSKKATAKLSSLMDENFEIFGGRKCTNCTGTAPDEAKRFYTELKIGTGGTGSVLFGYNLYRYSQPTWTDEVKGTWKVRLPPNGNTYDRSTWRNIKAQGKTTPFIPFINDIGEFKEYWNTLALNMYDIQLFAENGKLYYVPLLDVLKKLPTQAIESFFSFADSLEHAFMAENEYVINDHGYFEKSSSNWKNGKKHGQWYSYQNFNSALENNKDDSDISSEVLYDEGDTLTITYWTYYYNTDFSPSEIYGHNKKKRYFFDYRDKSREETYWYGAGGPKMAEAISKNWDQKKGAYGKVSYKGWTYLWNQDWMQKRHKLLLENDHGLIIDYNEKRGQTILLEKWDIEAFGNKIGDPVKGLTVRNVTGKHEW